MIYPNYKTWHYEFNYISLYFQLISHNIGLSQLLIHCWVTLTVLWLLRYSSKKETQFWGEQSPYFLHIFQAVRWQATEFKLALDSQHLGGRRDWLRTKAVGTGDTSTVIKITFRRVIKTEQHYIKLGLVEFSIIYWVILHSFWFIFRYHFFFFFFYTVHLFD